MLDNLKNQVFKRAGGRCEYCKSLAKYSPAPFPIDHILPVSMGGQDNIENLALSCGGCNGHKYNKTEGIDPITGKFSPLFNPRKDLWDNHFKWNSLFTHIVGITPTGRAAVSTLNMNRLSVINLRNITKLTGEHPPN